MLVTKVKLLEETIEITKAYAASGGATPLAAVIENVWRKLNELNQEPTR